MDSDLIVLKVAGLKFWLDARNSSLRFMLNECQSKFLIPLNRSLQVPFSNEGIKPLPASDTMILRIKNDPFRGDPPTGQLLVQSENWELWLDESSNYVFVALREIPPIQAVIAPSFQNGVIRGDFTLRQEENFFPLDNLGIKIFANWLATFGDFVLHASGVILDGKGYCFAGESGIGKSTLAKRLAANPSAVILGEDQVVVRFIDGQFWIYGTPWHLDPDMCAPQGAPLEKLFFLERNGVRKVSRISPLDGVTRLLQTAFLPYYRVNAMPKILDHLSRLSEHIPFYTLSYNLGDDVWPLIL